jgi:lysophospholipase L1-like esterase
MKSVQNMRDMPLQTTPTQIYGAGRPNPSQWEAEMRAFEEADKKQFPAPNGIVFTGSSTIRLWKTFAQDFPRHQTINRGFGGSNLADATYFVDRIVTPYKPRQVVLFAGTNDIAANHPPEQVALDFLAFVTKIKVALPGTRIAYIEMTTSPSRWEQRDRVVYANKLIRDTCGRMDAQFIPVRERLFDKTYKPRPELFIKDQLHLNADGYKILANAVRPFLK